MKITIISDAAHPQVNGVVRTLEMTMECLKKEGYEIQFVNPNQFKNYPCPTYPEIRLSLFPYKKLKHMVNEFDPDFIHIATEGPLGKAGRKYCLKNKYKYTTSYHTDFPAYVNARTNIPKSWVFKWLKWFHKPASSVLVTTETIKQELENYQFDNIRVWYRGVDIEQFKITQSDVLSGFKKPIWVNVGRVTMDKNLEAFLNLDLPGTKVIVGDGPDRKVLEEKYPNAIFTGYKFGEELVKYINACDVFVFPSRTDTFGLVMLEANACGLPVAAYPVKGPIDVIKEGVNGSLNNDLRVACRSCLAINSKNCRTFAEKHSWENCTKTFIQYLVHKNEGKNGGSL